MSDRAAELDAFILRSGPGTAAAFVAEPVVGASVVRAYAVEARTQERIDEAVAEAATAFTLAPGFSARFFAGQRDRMNRLIAKAQERLAKIKAGGGTIFAGPIDIPIGRLAVAADRLGDHQDQQPQAAQRPDDRCRGNG